MDLKITENRPLFFDGATGTMLQKWGLEAGKLGECFNIERPNTVLKLHKTYLKAGADIIKTNTFSANALKAEALGYNPDDIIREGVKLARKAVSECRRGFVALDIGPLGTLLEPFGALPFEEAVGCFSGMIKAGCELADLVLIETMSDLYELKAAIIAAKESCELPIFVTCTFDESGKMLCGADPETMVTLAESLGVTALGINCGCGPELAAKIVEKISKVASVPVIANPNAGMPKVSDGRTVFEMDAESFGESARELIFAGAQIIGGCCGTTPEHIASMYKNCKGIVPAAVTDKGITAVCSYSKVCRIDSAPIVIGERINPTGKPKLKAALREGRVDYLVSEGLSQEEAGAHVLDVNVGLPDIDEADMLVRTVKALQKVTRLPLQIDTSDASAMEAALRYYNGKPLINSVNGTKESILKVLPLAKKYGGVIVALTLDENGIPATAHGRVKIAEKILKVATAVGIPQKNIIFDALTLTAATDPNAARVTLDTLRQIEAKLGARTVLGVSNVSFGLPERETVTAVFLSQALGAGLSAAIMNPLSEKVMKAYKAHMALCGADANCADYIASCNTEAEEKQDLSDLSVIIEKGLADKAAEACKSLLETKEPTEVINEKIIPALNKVGESFEKGKLFLPELLMAASASEAAFDVIKTKLSLSGAKRDMKGTVILATVKGDIHDLGKNIVKALLANFGYEVIDMGKDAEPQKIADLAKEKGVKLVGLSALMTTTLSAMEESVRLIRESCPECKVMVGGAVVTSEYAEKIGALYAKDAVSGVRIADEVFVK